MNTYFPVQDVIMIAAITLFIGLVLGFWAGFKIGERSSAPDPDLPSCDHCGSYLMPAIWPIVAEDQCTGREAVIKMQGLTCLTPDCPGNMREKFAKQVEIFEQRERAARQ